MLSLGHLKSTCVVPLDDYPHESCSQASVDGDNSACEGGATRENWWDFLRQAGRKEGIDGASS